MGQSLSQDPGAGGARTRQHASFERNRRTSPIFRRPGEAVDFQIAGQGSLDIAMHIVATLAFDSVVRVWICWKRRGEQGGRSRAAVSSFVPSAAQSRFRNRPSPAGRQAIDIVTNRGRVLNWRSTRSAEKTAAERGFRGRSARTRYSGLPANPFETTRFFGAASGGETFCCAKTGGGGGIRTHGTLARTTVFETAPFDRSGTPPRLAPDPCSFDAKRGH